MALDTISSDYFRNASALLDVEAGDFAQASWNQDDQVIRRLAYRFGMAPKRFDPASVDAIPAPRDITQETLGTDLLTDPIRLYTDELEEDVVLPFPPVQKYVVDLTVTKITRWKPRLIVTEDLL
ncbi:hypothetical protein ACFL6S_09725 [Candidatus Poribacteria bacterium]